MKINIVDKEKDIYIFQKDKDNYIHFCPSRGGLITKWQVRSQSILYFDEMRFSDVSKSIRGGIPILFPICGKLDCKDSIFGKNYLALMQHGFARDLKWEFNYCDEHKTLDLQLSNNDITEKYFPFLFDLTVRVLLGENYLAFEIFIRNKSLFEMPLNFGLHPYFNISDFKNLVFLNYPCYCQNQINNCIQSTSSTLLNIAKGIDLLMYSYGSTTICDYGLKRKITLINPEPFDITVIWSESSRNMLCMEPWTSPRNSLIEGYRNIIIPPKNTKKLRACLKIDDI